MAEKKPVVPEGVKRYANHEDGRKVLKIAADSVEFANSLNRSCWATLIPETGRDFRFFVGPSTMLVLRTSSWEVEITVMSKLLDEDLQETIRGKRVGRRYKRPEGASRHRLELVEFLKLWPRMRAAHREALSQAATHVRRMTMRSSEHRSDAISFLNDALSGNLVQPGYVEAPDTSTAGPPPTAPDGFASLTQWLRDEELLFSREVVANYVLALQTKRFAILTGISGTGKTRIAKAVAQHFLPVRSKETKDIEEPGDNYVVVPVRPDWVDNRGLLGYFNPLTNQYSTTPFLDLLIRAKSEEKRPKSEGEDPHPFFVILDEMNLARVEHYFSDFLSALESGEPIPLHDNEAVDTGEAQSGPRIPRQLTVPDNVFFTGTVNVDETTYMFSPKVLDRAFTIEFDQVDLEGFTRWGSYEGQSDLDLDLPETSLRFAPYRPPGRGHWVEFSKTAEVHHKALLQLHEILQTEHRHFGYRVANEIARFVNLAREQSKNTDRAVDAAFDLALLQKVLPKFHGTKQELESLLGRLFNFAVYGPDRSAKGDQNPKLQDWRVVAGRLTTRTRSPPTSGKASPETGDTTPEPEQEPSAGGEPPVFPRTGAKIWRMLDRLQKRGFTSFME